MDHLIYKGVVLDNLDPNKLMRLKIFIPELSNQPHSWVDNRASDNLIRYPGLPALSRTEVDMLREHLPWAEQCAPLMGEAGLAMYFAPIGVSTSKATYVSTKQAKNTPPSNKQGGGPPRVTSTIAGAQAGAAAGMVGAWDGQYGKQDPTNEAFGPKNSGPETSGVFGVPQVGAHLWVFHQRGDINHPVYFGVSPSFKDTGLVFESGGYPDSGYEVTGPPSPDSATEPTTDSGRVARRDLPPGDPVEVRADLGKIDDDTKRLLYELTQAEVGSQGDQAQIAFMETVANRAAIQGTSIRSIITNRAYYEPLQTGVTRPVGTQTRSSYDQVFHTVVNGSNLTNGATHNSSAGVAASVRRGGYDAATQSIREIGPSGSPETFYSKTYEQASLRRLGVL